jgi:hypothetical protein
MPAYQRSPTDKNPKEPGRPKTHGPMHLRNMDLTLKQAFKVYCARHGYSMNRAIEHLMHEAVRENRILRGIRGVTESK